MGYKHYTLARLVMSETEIMQGSLSDLVAPLVTVCVPVRNESEKH